MAGLILSTKTGTRRPLDPKIYIVYLIYRQQRLSETIRTTKMRDTVACKLNLIQYSIVDKIIVAASILRKYCTAVSNGVSVM